jgi:two-component system, OmpR family, sensor kinase
VVSLQDKVKKSLQLRLSVWLISVILLFATVTGALSFMSAFYDANEMQDDQLKQIASLVNTDYLQFQTSESTNHVTDVDPDSRVVIQALRPVDTPVLDENKGWFLDANSLDNGMHDIKVKKESWRVYIRTLDSGVRIAVGIHTHIRNESARNSALRTLLPLIALLPILLLLVGYLTRRMFMPVKQLSVELDQRAESNVTAINCEGLPTEILPFALAINRLLLRVSQSVALQRRFIANAAHELRSPLTALSLQAERLSTLDVSPQISAPLTTLQGGIKRTRLLLEQLLAFARAQEAPKMQSERISVQRIFREVIENLLPLAVAKNIDLGVVSNTDVWMSLLEIDLKTVVKNLVENAIRYTPRNGNIDISVQKTERNIIFKVQDTGPGIAETERERVFDPFYRVIGHDEIGSGLGLSIVKTITDRLNAEVILSDCNDSLERTGLLVTVIFPIEISKTPD